jgi:hypothetical protein
MPLAVYPIQIKFELIRLSGKTFTANRPKNKNDIFIVVFNQKKVFFTAKF